MTDSKLWLVDDTGRKIAGVIAGGLPSKSNSRRLITVGKHPRSIKSEEALSFVNRVRSAAIFSGLKTCLKGATCERDMKKGIPFLYLEAKVYGDSLLRDLDCELLPDALQNAGVIENDRAIRQKHYYWELSKSDPRVEFEIGYIEAGPKLE